jgi:hypothetical protein
VEKLYCLHALSYDKSSKRSIVPPREQYSVYLSCSHSDIERGFRAFLVLEGVVPQLKGTLAARQTLVQEVSNTNTGATI